MQNHSQYDGRVFRLLCHAGVWLLTLPAIALAQTEPIPKRSDDQATPSKATPSKATPSKADPNKTSPKKNTSAKPSQLFDGKDMQQWSIVDKFFFEDHGKVHIEDGVLILESGTPGTGIAWKMRPPKKNYEVSFQAKRIKGRDFFCGLTFPVNDSYCTFVIGGWGGQAVGLSNLDDFAAIENETTDYLDVKDGQWYKIRLRVDDESIKAWIDKKMFVDVKIDDHEFDIWWEQEPLRPLGIATWDTTAGFKDIQLLRLK